VHDPEKWEPVFLGTNAKRLPGDHAPGKERDHDPIRLDRIMIVSFSRSMISGQTLRVCPEENRFPLFRIML